MHGTPSGTKTPSLKGPFIQIETPSLKRAKAAHDPTGLCLQAQHLFVTVPMRMWYQTIGPFNKQEMKRKKKNFRNSNPDRDDNN